MARKRLSKEFVVHRNASIEIKSVSGESLSVPAGAAGTVKVAQLANLPIRNSAGNDIGGFGDTSLVLTGASVPFTNEVAYGTADDDLENGDYWVDYARGEVRGKKATTATSATAAYKIAVINMSIDDTDVTLTIDTTGIATSAKQDTQIATLGATTDAAVVTDTDGSISGKMRGLVKIFADVWDSTVHFLGVGLANKIWGEDEDHDVLKVEGQFVYTNITTATTTVVKSGEGLLHAITINKPVINAVITAYNNTAGSGSTIAAITMGAAVTGADSKTLLYDVKFDTGLTIVTSQATDLTIVTRP